MESNANEINPGREALPFWLGWARVATGLAQGSALYALHRSAESGTWPASVPPMFGAIALVVLFAPLIVIGGLGALRRTTLGIWMTAAVAVLAFIGWHDQARDFRGYSVPWPADANVAAAALVFVAHHLIAAGDEARRWIAPYERYFDLGWRHGAQLVLSVGFVCALWLLLHLGAALFTIIGIEWLRETIGEPWFYFPVTCVAFASAIHLTDLRSGLVRGFRALGLTLLAWLGPVLALMAAAFLIALPFTGLQPLWSTQSASAILLSAAGALIVLINAAYQDGGAHASGSRILRWAARVAALLLAPLVLLSSVAISLRVGQYGWTGDRVAAAAVLVVAALYALLYLLAAFWRPWLRFVERANIAAAFVVLGVIGSVYTPIADPARIGVADQLARLERGVVAPDDFDYVYLAFDSGRYGRVALDQLAASENAIVAERARAVRQYSNRWEAVREQGPEPSREPAPDTEPRSRLVVVPEGAVLPQGFDPTTLTSGVLYRCRQVQCEAMALDVTGDGQPEVLVAWENRISVFGANESGAWEQFAFTEANCWHHRSLAGRRVETAEPSIRDLVIDGVRVQLRAERNYRHCR